MHGTGNCSLEIVFLLEKYDPPQSQISMTNIKLHARTDNENRNLYRSALPYFFLVFFAHFFPAGSFFDGRSRAFNPLLFRCTRYLQAVCVTSIDYSRRKRVGRVYV